MPDMVITVSITVLMVISLKNIVWFFVTIKRSFDKFNSLDARARNKILLLDYYMVFARNFSKNDLVSLGLLNDEEIKKINGIPEYGERIQAARGIITSMKG